jgi:hypothetical protein
LNLKTPGPKSVPGAPKNQKKNERLLPDVKEPLFSLFIYSTKNGPAFPGGRISSSSRLRTGLFFLLDKGNDAKQPCAQGGLEFLLRAPLIKRIYGFAATGKRNVAAGKTCFAAILRHELHQQTFGAGLRMIRIMEIRTGGRILENKIRTPRKALRFSVPARNRRRRVRPARPGEHRACQA